MPLRLEALLRLQQLDHQKAVHRERLDRLPSDLAAIRQRLEAAQQAKAQVQRALEENQKQRRERERDVEVHEEHMRKLKARLDDIKTNKEYQAHLTEIETAKQGLRNTEDDLLRLMEQGELQLQQVKQSEEQLAQATDAAHANEAKLTQEAEQIKREVEQLKTEAAQVEQSIDAGLLKEYHRIQSRRKGSAFVQIQNGSCAGCRLAIPPQLVTEVRRQEEAYTCPHCGRLLYWPQVTGPS